MTMAQDGLIVLKMIIALMLMMSEHASIDQAIVYHKLHDSLAQTLIQQMNSLDISLANQVSSYYVYVQ
jgi:hypothetical protein